MSKLVSPNLYILLFILNRLVSILLKPWNSAIPKAIRSLGLASGKFRVDPYATTAASTDFGGMAHETPAAVLDPTCIDDIIDLVRFSYSLPSPFSVAARGHGHSVSGQATARDGVVVNMGAHSGGTSIRVCPSGRYADVGGGELWIDVLRACLAHGVTPVSWTDYLYLTVGGTLSNAGISGQMFRYGPQITNVLELDVITGKGELVTCSKDTNSDLFFAVLGGLGQFGIITRARIVLEEAPTRARWVRLLYDDFSKFTRDQEHLISINNNNNNNNNEGKDGLDYLEGSLIINHDSSRINNWRSSSFFSPSDRSEVTPLLSSNPVIYCLDAVKYYHDGDSKSTDDELAGLTKDLRFASGMMFQKDMAYFDFLNRVTCRELEPQDNGLWKASHPWLNLFVPKSRISDFNSGVFQDIILKHKITDPILVYPTTTKTWDDRMSAVTPEEEIFYCVGLLYSCDAKDGERLDGVNKEILKYCEEGGIKMKQYLPCFQTKQEWMKHFGKKWNNFQENKARFDPKMILSPGQRIFN